MGLLALLLLFTLVINCDSVVVACPTGAALIPNCITCITSGNNIICQTCLNGYYLLGSSCVACSLAIANCQFCTKNTAQQLTCSVCLTGGLLNGTCQNCSAISGCTSCQVISNQLRCVTCTTGMVYYSVQNSCVACQINNCSSCTVNSSGFFNCSSCNVGYYLSNNVCLLCASAIQYCSSCLTNANNEVVCASCASSVMYPSNKACVVNCTLAGQPTCQTCNITAITNGITTCSSCIAGYYLNTATQLCQSCSGSISGCLNCTLAAGKTSCLQCISGYYLSSGSCLLCSTITANCQQCQVSSTVTCTQCKSGYYLNSTDKNCYSCSNSPYVNASFAPGTCAVCQVGTDGLLACTQCTVAYYFSGGVCVSCAITIANCSTCSTGLICTQCIAGSLLSNGACSPCSNTYANCLYCNSVQCTDCMINYYTTDNKVCVANCLVANCQTCQTKNNLICAACKQGYNLLSGQCQMTICQGALAFNGIACSCPILNYVSGSQCLPCSANNCLYCGSNICTACLRGYYLTTNYICSICPSRCQLCTASNSCLLCDDGYYFTGLICSKITDKVATLAGLFKLNNLNAICGQGCLRCTSETSCSDCYRGYYLNVSKCVQCSENCLACNLASSNETNTTCLLCASGTAKINNVCTTCSDPNCISCDFNAQFCLQCRVTYTATSTGGCLACASHCDFCDSNGPGTCDPTSCSIGYTRYNYATCLPCLGGCSSCNAIFPFTCIGCLIGSYNQTTTGQCLNCPQGCYNCSSSTVCTSCLEYYYLSGGQCVMYCSLPCVNCNWSNGSQICSGCLRGYTLIGGVCSPSLACSNSVICQFCPMEYFAYKGVCYSCPSFCGSCAFNAPSPTFVISGNNYLSYTSCSFCLQGYYLSSSSKTCTLCPSNCKICSSSKNCVICKKGYFMEKRYYNFGVTSQYGIGQCLTCSSNCLTCQLSPNRCTSCSTGEKLVSFKCMSDSSVIFSLTLAVATSVTAAGITASYQQIMNDLYTAFGEPYASNSALVTITSLQLGSLVINGAASTSTIDSNTAYTNIQSGLQNTQSFGGYTLSSHTVQAQGFVPSSGSSESVSPILIVIIVGSIVGVVLIVLCICCLARRNRAKQAEQEGEEIQTGTEQPPTSKSMIQRNITDIQSQFDNPNPPPVSHRQAKRKRQVSHISRMISQEPNGDLSRQTRKHKHQGKRVSYKEQDIVYDERQKSSRYPQQGPSRSRYPESQSRRPSHREKEQLDRTIQKSKANNYIDYGSESQSSNHYRSTNMRPQSSSPYLPNDTHLSRNHQPPASSSGGKRSGSVEKKQPNKNTYYI